MWLKGNEDVRKYLIRMVEYSIGKKLDKYELGSNEAGVISLKSIANKYDIVLINTSFRSKINVEMNRSVNGIKGIYQTYNKNDTYLGHMLSDFYNGLDSSERYKEKISISQVNLNCFYAPEGKLIHRLDFEFVDRNFEVTKNGISSHQIYLPRMRDLWYDEDEENLDIYKDFTLLLCNSYEEMKVIADGNKERIAVINFLKDLERNEEVVGYIDNEEFEMALRKTEMEEMKEESIKQGKKQGHEEGLEEGKKKGYEQGLEQGLEQEKINTAKRMLEEKMDIELISKITNLTVDEIKKLIN